MTRTSRYLALGASVAALLALGLAVEAGADGRHGQRFMQHMDGDGDDIVTRAEAMDASANRFEEIDTNGDGKATVEEFEAHFLAKMRERMARRIERLDTDGDGAISAEEFAARATHRFDRVDRDGDGRLSEEEFASGRHHRHGHGHGHDG